MRSPSAKCLINRVNIYRFTPSFDGAGSISGNPYPDTPTYANVAASVQPAEPERFIDAEHGVLIQKTMWRVMTRRNYSLKLDDKIVWVDDASVSHNLYVHGNADQAGRASAFVAECEERK